MARKHIVFMYETHQGLDNVPKTLAMVTDPLKVRIRNAIEKANDTTAEEPDKAAEAAHDLLLAVREPLEIIKEILPSGNTDRVDLCDAVAEAALNAVKQFLYDEGDLEEAVAILDRARLIAESEELRTSIADKVSQAQDATLLKPIIDMCENTREAAEESPEKALIIAQKLLILRLPFPVQQQAMNVIAVTVMQCTIMFGNRTEDWESCVEYLERCLALANDEELKGHICDNLVIAKRNSRECKDLTPILSAPSLTSVNGFGFTLYGETDRDPQTGSYLSTYYFIFFHVPIFPIRRYRIIRTTEGISFLGQAPLRSFDKWHIFIAISIAAFALHGMLSEKNPHDDNLRLSPSSYQTSPKAPTQSPQVYGSHVSSSLSQQIEAGKARAKELESQLQYTDDQIESLDQLMESHRLSDRTSEYNELVPSFNSLVSKRNAIYDEYSDLIDDINVKVDRHNSAIR